MYIYKKNIIPALLFCACLLVQAFQLYAVNILWYEMDLWYGKDNNMIFSELNNSRLEMVNRYKLLYSSIPFIFFIAILAISTLTLHVTSKKKVCYNYFENILEIYLMSAFLCYIFWRITNAPLTWLIIIFGIANILWCYIFYRKNIISDVWDIILIVSLIPALLCIIFIWVIMTYPSWSFLFFTITNILWCYKNYRVHKVISDAWWLLAKNNARFGVLFSLMVWFYIYLELSPSL